MFSGLQINFYVTDVERAVAFYTAIGAFESFRTPRDGTPLHVEVKLAGVTVGLASVAAARDIHGLDVSADAAGAELVLWTDDADAAYAVLVAAGGTTMKAPHDMPNGLRGAWVADPDGNPVEVVQEPAAATAMD
ncbi:MAG: VOC family protein [Nocardioides sp.]